MKTITFLVLTALCLSSAAQAGESELCSDGGILENMILHQLFKPDGQFDQKVCTELSSVGTVVANVPHEYARIAGEILTGIATVGCPIAEQINLDEAERAIAWMTGCPLPPTPPSGFTPPAQSLPSQTHESPAPAPAPPPHPQPQPLPLQSCEGDYPATMDRLNSSVTSVKGGFLGILPFNTDALDTSIRGKFSYYTYAARSCDEYLSKSIVYTEVLASTLQEFKKLFMTVPEVGHLWNVNVLGKFEFHGGDNQQKRAMVLRCAQSDSLRWDHALVPASALEQPLYEKLFSGSFENAIADKEANLAYSSNSCDEVISRLSQFRSSMLDLIGRMPSVFP